MPAPKMAQDTDHVRERRRVAPTPHLQPPRLVKSRGAIGRTSGAGGDADRGGVAARRRRGRERVVADRVDAAVCGVRDSIGPARRSHLATRVLARLPFGIVVALGPVTGFVAAMVMALTIFVPTPLLAALSYFLLGAGPILWVISTTTLRQSVTPPRLLGRVSAINIMSYGARPLGSALGAVIGGFYGAETCLYLSAAIFGTQALVILMSPVVALARQPEMVPG